MADEENVLQTSEITKSENGYSGGNTACKSDNKEESMSEDKSAADDGIQQKISFKMPSLPNMLPKNNPISLENTIKKESTEKQASVKATSQVESKVPEKQVAGSDSKLSPAERLKDSQITISYKEPTWSGLPTTDEYSFEILKNGMIVENVKLNKPYIVIGRLPSCDVPMEHPSLSRHHAVVQYCKSASEGHEKGWHLYDLDSTHGTWINKNKVYPQKFYRIRVGHVLKFGGSTRLFILQGPEEDTEEESDLSVAEMKEQRDKQKREAEFLRQAELAEEQRIREELKAKEEAKGCLWGMGEDAEEEEEDENQFSSLITPENEALYIDDPKKALKGFFEREGYDPPEYDVVETGRGKYKCCVELPIDTPAGQPIVAEALVSGKKKEAVIQCALEACRIIDKHGMLRASTHESRKRKKKNWEDDDFYDSDEDIYLDRTGDIEKKRKQRMQKAGKFDSNADTHESLLAKHSAVVDEIQEIDAKLEKAKADSAAMENEEMDALDAYMMAIKSGAMDTKTKMKLKRQLLELRQEEQKLRRLVNITKPATMPDLKGPTAKSFSNPDNKKETGKAVPSFSRMKRFAVQKKPTQVPVPVSLDSENIAEEEEEEEEDESLDQKLTHSAKSEISDRSNKNNSEQMEIIDETITTSEQKSAKNKQVSVSKNVVKGPSFPPPGDHNISSADVELSSDTFKKDGEKHSHIKSQNKMENQDEVKDAEIPLKREKKEPTKQTKPKKAKTGNTAAGPSYDSTDPDFAVWLPPKNQSGDGKTHLNEKFGY